MALAGRIRCLLGRVAQQQGVVEELEGQSCRAWDREAGRRARPNELELMRQHL